MRRFFELTSHLHVDEIKELSDEIRERKEAQGEETDSLVYGEISYSAMYELVKTLKSKGYLAGTEDLFLDLGSGVGKAVLMAALLHPFQRCVGFEVLPELHQMAEELLRKCQTECTSVLQSVQADYLQADWPQASVVLSNSTCLSRETFDQLVLKAELLPSGSVFISMSKAIHNAQWSLVEYSQKALHWGVCSFYIYVKN
jgi:hypothetical protein